MNIIYSNNHKLHDPKYEIWNGKPANYLDKPSRSYAILREIKKIKRWGINPPFEDPESPVRNTHDKKIIDFLENNKADKVFTKEECCEIILEADESISVSPRTYEAALSAVSVALTGATVLRNGQDRVVYSLCRPPGRGFLKT